MSQPTKKSNTSVRKRKPVILIVDDEPILLDLAEAALQEEGYVFQKFSDPEEALKSFSKAKPRPDLLITDYAMGKMNGIELIERCRALEPGLKSILLSGTAGAEILMETPVKVDRFLAKPYPREQLAGMVRRLLDA